MTKGGGSTGRLYAGRTADERRAVRRDALMEAGLDRFGTEGYQAVSIERICSAARMSTRNFYDDFPGREALLRAVYDRVIGEVRAAVASALSSAPADPAGRAQAALSAVVHALLDDPRRARVACLEVVGLSYEFEAHRRRVMTEFADLLEAESRRLVAQGHLPARPDHRLRSLALVGGALEVIAYCAHLADPPPVPVVIDELVDLFLAASAPAASGRPPA